jgi:hypothetical protein
MAQSELSSAPGTDRRVRHEARYGLAAAAVSLGASAVLAGLLSVAARWLG